MAHSFFSIIITALNPGRRLLPTLNSVLEQTFPDYEVILKDGGSTDGSLCRKSDGTWAVAGDDGNALQDGRIRILRQKDRGIYDGMNQALPLIRGKYVLFLNCGDRLYDRNVLSRIAGAIRERMGGAPERDTAFGDKTAAARQEEYPLRIWYGDQFNELQKSHVHSSPRLDDFACYRNVPCHQVCFYDARLFSERGYDTDYKVRADYEHFLWSLYEKKAEAVYLPVTVAAYEGGGFSEARENRKRSALEHRVITRFYMGRMKSVCFWFIMLATLAPLRTWAAENPKLAKGYNALKSMLYKRMSGKKEKS